MPSIAEPLPEPTRLTRRRADRMEGRQTRDRLTTMLVLAGLLHGLIILGISFSTPDTGGASSDRGMEVLLVSEELPEEKDNPSATYLSQRTQSGSGNTQDRRAARLPSQGQPGGPEQPQQQMEDPSEQLLTSNSGAAATAIQIQSLPEAPQRTAPASAQEQLQRSRDDELVLRGITRDELYISADTRASRLAPYLDSWRRRVERIGTINYPRVAQRGMKGNPVIEVALQRDGKLRSARILRSSGHAEIDAAALDILRLASPFDPFPPDLARDYRSLRFAYEWQFEGGGGATSVTVP